MTFAGSTTSGRPGGPDRAGRVLLVAALAGLLIAPPSSAQKRPNSPVLKSYVPSDARSLVIPGDESYELWQEFMLVRKANDGDPVAEHELGIRYISGKGFPADTAKAAYWIGKAAAQNLPSARYNLAILENNGWGCPWAPFQAYRDVTYAAAHGMPEALYALGLFNLDNLVIPRNEKEAWCLIATAADSGYDPAFGTLAALERRGIGRRNEVPPPPDSTDPSAASQSPRVVFLDFDRDTSSQTNDTTLVGELLRDGSVRLSALRSADSASLRAGMDAGADTALMGELRRAASAGSPEALTLLGRWAEEGRRMPKNPLQAAADYLRAVRADSPRAPELLWNLIHTPDFFQRLKTAVDRREPEAEWIWAGLVALRLDGQITLEQARAMLTAAAERNNAQALTELGVWHAQGIGAERNRARAIAAWKRAAALGSRDAAIRLAVAEVAPGGTPRIAFLREAAGDGSLLAAVALGTCAERGIGIPQNTGEAAQLYRNAAQRGSIAGFEALKRMYDERRPAGAEFRPLEF